MLAHKDSFILQQNSFKKVKNILYEDYVTTDFNTFTVNDFQKYKSLDTLYKLETDFKSYFFDRNNPLLINDFLLKERISSSYISITSEDTLLINKRYPDFTKNNIRFTDKLYLNQYDYATTFIDIINKSKLPKAFLLKALTTGCPDEEYPKAKEYNKTLQQLLDHERLTLEEFSKKIITDNSVKPERKYLSLSYKLLDLIYLCITNSYELLTHTTVKLKIKDTTVFENVMTLLLDLKCNKTVYSDIYNSQQYSIIIINSNLIYELFKYHFNNYSFILNLSKSFSLYLFKKIKDITYFEIDNEESLKYLQEFLFRFQLLYSEEIIDNNVYLVKTNPNSYTELEEHFELKIKNVIQEEDPVNFIGVL